MRPLGFCDVPHRAPADRLLTSLPMTYRIHTRSAAARTAWLLLLALALLGAAPAHAAKRVALVVGNAAYAHAQPLLNAKNDAADIAAALRDIGFEVIERQDLDARGMREGAREFARKIKGADLALFYYAGHAIQLEGGNYLVPTDARIEDQADVPLSTVDLAHIVGAMESEKRANVIFIDACRDNPFLRAVFPATRSTGSHGLAPVSTGVGTLIAFATSPGRVAQDGKGRNSPFTAAILKHIRTPGLEVRSMLSRVRADVMAATGNKQIPWDNSSLVGDVHLAPGAGAPRLMSEADIALWKSIAGIDTETAYLEYLEKFGDRGEFSTLARQRLAAIRSAKQAAETEKQRGRETAAEVESERLARTLADAEAERIARELAVKIDMEKKRRRLGGAG